MVGMLPSHQGNPCLLAHCAYVRDRGARLSLTSAFWKQSLMSRAGCCALTASILRLSSESNNPLVSTITPFGSTKSGVYTDVNTYVRGTDSYSNASPRWLRLAATDASKPERYRLEVVAPVFDCFG